MEKLEVTSICHIAGLLFECVESEELHHAIKEKVSQACKHTQAQNKHNLKAAFMT